MGEDVARVIRELDDEIDVTVTIESTELDGHFMLAITGSAVFIGLTNPHGIFQYRVTALAEGDRIRFVIGGQETDIESRRVVDVVRAGEIAQGWLKGEMNCDDWERR